MEVKIILTKLDERNNLMGKNKYIHKKMFNSSRKCRLSSVSISVCRLSGGVSPA